MTRLVIAIFTTALVVALISKCRRRPDLGAHATRCPDKCDPRLDELQAWVAVAERARWN